MTAVAHDNSNDNAWDEHGDEDDTCFVSFAHDCIDYLHPGFWRIYEPRGRVLSKCSRIGLVHYQYGHVRQAMVTLIAMSVY